VVLAKDLHTWGAEAVLPKGLVLLTESKVRVPATARDRPAISKEGVKAGPARDLLQMECAKETFLRICHSEVVPGADAKVQVKRNLADHNGSVLGLPGLFQGLDYLNAQSVSLNRKSMLVIARVFHLR
jgi:hypothetical protein